MVLHADRGIRPIAPDPCMFFDLHLDKPAPVHRMDGYTSKYDNRASISMLNQDLQELVDAAVLHWSTDCMVFRLVYIHLSSDTSGYTALLIMPIHTH